MCCSLTYKDGPRTIVIDGFPTVAKAAKHAEEKDLHNYILRVTPEE